MRRKRSIEEKTELNCKIAFVFSMIAIVCSLTEVVIKVVSLAG